MRRFAWQNKILVGIHRYTIIRENLLFKWKDRDEERSAREGKKEVQCYRAQFLIGSVTAEVRIIRAASLFFMKEFFMKEPTINAENGERLKGLRGTAFINGAVLHIIRLIRACAGALLIIR